MKRVLSGLFAVLMMLVLCTSALAAGIITPYDISDTVGEFVIDSQGLAQIRYRSVCDSNTESITVTVKLEKRTLLLFWKDVEVWTIQSNEASCNGQVSYQLTDGGTYRCTIVYEATNSDGTVDTNEYQKKVEYDPA